MERFQRDASRQEEQLKAIADELHEFQSSLEGQSIDTNEMNGIVREARNTKKILSLRPSKHKTRFVNKHQINHWDNINANGSMTVAEPTTLDVPDQMIHNDELVISEDGISIIKSRQKTYSGC